ncbi:MAG TPA: ShlB/FhaC/HecB family hemolysin secretion/activation protein [Nitrospira sp.]|nr:ShlB/FhaC/HecB family hemolysin secretion/activation protein [Nitrospira sp.]
MTRRAMGAPEEPPSSYRHIGWGSLVGPLLAVSIAQAQIAPPIFDPSGRSGEPPAPLKKEFERPEPPPPPSPVLPPPPLPPEEPAEQRLGQIKVFVKDIQVTGSTVFTQAQLDEVTAPFENRTLTTEDLERLRLTLTVKYINAGYFTSGAIIPDQDVKDGIIIVQVIEGKLTRIDVSGNRYFADSYLRSRVEKGVHTPVSLAPLQEQLQLLQQDRRIERINAELRPGDVQGESRLNLKVTDRNPFHAYIEGNNYQVPLVGEFRGLGTVVYDNVTGHGDPFTLTFGGSAGAFPIIDASYAIPLNRYDTTFSPYYRRTDYTLIEQPFKPLDIKTNTEIIGLSLRQPIYRTLTDEVVLSIIGEHLFTQSFIFSDVPFDLFPGFQNGAATVSALRFAQEWTHRSTDTVVAGRSRFSVGLNVLGATINSGNLPGQGNLPSGQFFSWLGQVQGIKQFGENLLGMQLLGRMDLQLTNSPLFPLEQVSVGGRYSVRGYREVTLLRDNAFIASLESRFPLWRRASGEPIFQFAPFADVGSGWSLGANKTATESIGNPSTLASVGAGLRWSILPNDRANYEVYWGYKLVRDPPERVGNTVQDYGVHMGLVVNLF